MSDETKIPEVTAFGIQPILTHNGAVLLVEDVGIPVIQTSMQGNPPQQTTTIQMPTKPVALIKLSLEHLKLATIMLHREIKKHEEKEGAINISKTVLAERQIDLAKEW